MVVTFGETTQMHKFRKVARQWYLKGVAIEEKTSRNHVGNTLTVLLVTSPVMKGQWRLRRKRKHQWEPYNECWNPPRRFKPNLWCLFVEIFWYSCHVPWMWSMVKLNENRVKNIKPFKFICWKAVTRHLATNSYSRNSWYDRNVDNRIYR